MAKHYDVTILTVAQYINPVLQTEYIKNVLHEDHLVKQALENAGLTVTRKDWADPNFNWSKTKTALFRTTWDYFHRYDKFIQWLQNTSQYTSFLNPYGLIKWNIDKHYLKYLSEQNIKIVPTRYIPKGSELSLNEHFKLTNWKHAVIKPTIGGAARNTYYLTSENVEIISQNLQEVMKEEDFMIQPFQFSVPNIGEWSFVFFGYEFSHAVLKKAQPGDFRVQDDFGGTIHPYNPHDNEIDFALMALKACPQKAVYARVDVILDNDGELAISELELIEPELWFRLNPNAAGLLANEVINQLG